MQYKVQNMTQRARIKHPLRVYVRIMRDEYLTYLHLYGMTEILTVVSQIKINGFFFKILRIFKLKINLID